ncbi:MAG: hypothetical protein RR075_02480 [Pygmaiobacter sp.]
MKRKTMILTTCAVLLLVSLTGYPLAKAERGAGRVQDRLVGIFITDEHLDLFDMDGYLNDNVIGFSGGELKLDSASLADYNGRLYASPIFEKTADTSAEKERIPEKYTFGEVEGVQLFVQTIAAQDDSYGHVSGIASDGIAESHMGLYYGDDEDKMTLDGTVYFLPGKNGQTHYINRVYQSSDGKIYATAGQGLSVEGIASEGEVMSQKLEDSITITENRKSKKKTTIINISIKTMLPPQKIVLLEMDENSALLSRTDYTPGKLPERIAPSSATSYLILESVKTDFDGTPKIERTLFSRGSEIIDSFYATVNHVLTKQSTEVIW